MKPQQANKLEKKRYNICVHEKVMYVDEGYKSDRAKSTNDENIPKIRRLL